MEEQKEFMNNLHSNNKLNAATRGSVNLKEVQDFKQDAFRVQNNRCGKVKKINIQHQRAKKETQTSQGDKINSNSENFESKVKIQDVQEDKSRLLSKQEKLKYTTEQSHDNLNNQAQKKTPMTTQQFKDSPIQSLEAELDAVQKSAAKQSVYLMKQKISECLTFFKEKLKSEMKELQLMDVFFPSLFNQGPLRSQLSLDLTDVPGLEQCTLTFDWKLGPNMDQIQNEFSLPTGEQISLFDLNLGQRHLDQSQQSVQEFSVGNLTKIPILPPPPSRDMVNQISQTNIDQLQELHQNVFKLIQNEESLERQRILKLETVSNDQTLKTSMIVKFDQDRQVVRKQIQILSNRYSQLYCESLKNNKITQELPKGDAQAFQK